MRRTCNTRGGDVTEGDQESWCKKLFMERRGSCFLGCALKSLYLFYLTAVLISTQKDNLPQSAQFPLCLEHNNSSRLTAHDGNHPTQASRGLQTILTLSSPPISLFLLPPSLFSVTSTSSSLSPEYCINLIGKAANGATEIEFMPSSCLTSGCGRSHSIPVK